jgi:hypothetical protein
MLANEQGYNIPPLLSNLSLFIPYPVAVNITNNTFVRYQKDGDTENDNVGLVVNIDAAEEQVKIRCFFTWS